MKAELGLALITACSRHSSGVAESTGRTCRPFARRRISAEQRLGDPPCRKAGRRRYVPDASALSNDGKYLLVLNGGYNPPSISVIDVADHRETQRIPVSDAWLGTGALFG